jgi:hypothetical protein
VFVYGGILCIGGWILSLPIVLLAKRLYAQPFWIILLVGTAIGPILMLLIALWMILSSPYPVGPFPPEDKNLVYLAIVVSFFTTLLYLLLMRRAARRIKT